MQVLLGLMGVIFAVTLYIHYSLHWDEWGVGERIGYFGKSAMVAAFLYCAYSDKALALVYGFFSNILMLFLFGIFSVVIYFYYSTRLIMRVDKTLDILDEIARNTRHHPLD